MGYRTLGDIAEELRKMKADGMTHQSIAYALRQVYDDERHAEVQALRVPTEGEQQ